MTEADLKQILAMLRERLAEILGDQLDCVLLYGSRARGAAAPDSDIDVLIVIDGDFDYGDLVQRTSEAVSELSLERDVVISRAFVSKARFDREQSPFLLNVRREGVLV